MRTNAKETWILLALFSLSGVCVLTGCQGLPGQAAQKVQATRTSKPGGCVAPSSPGIRVCEPPFSTTEDSPMQLIASATASQGKIIQMQVLADGRKIAQAHGDQFDAPIALSPGTHTLTVVARETGGSSLTSDPISVEIGGSTAGQACPPPSSPGVNVCSPQISEIGTSCAEFSWTTFLASGTAQNGTVREMQLWINGVDVANFPGNHINTNFVSDIFAPITIVEVDSKGHSISSPSFLFEGPC